MSEARLKQLSEANAYLEAGLRELQAQMHEKVALKRSEKSDKSAPGSKFKNYSTTEQYVLLECPSLDKLLAALDSQNLFDDLNDGRFQRSRIDYLEVNEYSKMPK